jgi:peroxiredoxin
VAKITDLSILSHEGDDITDLVLAEPQVLWIVCYDLNLTDTENINRINEFSKQAQAKGVKVYALSSAGEELKNSFIKEHNLNFDFYVTDGIVLKTMVRSNPGIMYLENGTVLGKWHHADVPSIEELH